MRKLHISIGICLLLLLAQQGAVLHQVSHLCQFGSVDVRVQSDTMLEKTCELCLAFSQLAHPASHSVHVPRFEPSACVAGAFLDRAAAPATTPTPRSRGPPALG
jgi:hypothetical protein